MPIDYLADRALLRGIVSVDDAEALLAWLQGRGAACVDLAACAHLHPANLQVLLAAGARVAEWPQEPALRAWLQPIFKQAHTTKEHSDG
nr:hypothetical protein [uncultured Duganella sp.]